MQRTPQTNWRRDHWLRAGDYLSVAADRFTPGRRGLDEAFARIERIEHVTGAVVADQNDLKTGQARAQSLNNEWQVAVFCHGMPGPVILPRGDHQVLQEMNPDRAADDERNPWWTELGPQPLFRGAVVPGPPRRVCRTTPTADSGQAPVMWPSAELAELAEPAVRRAASFTKPARALRVGDYLQVLAVRFPEHDRDTDEGFHRVEWVGYLDAGYSSRLLCDADWAVSLITVVAMHGLDGVLLLPDREVRVLVWPNPEREAWERRNVWMSEPQEAIVGPARTHRGRTR